MFRLVMRSVVACTLMLLLMGTTLLAQAPPSYPVKNPETLAEPSGEAIVADILVLRPAGFVATVFGTVLYVISLPISLPTRTADTVAQKLVVAPAKYTFVRQLGVPEAGTEPDITR
jgi:hypothetical protein